MTNTSKDWETWGAKDPYYGVLSFDKFRRDQLDASATTEFFASGDRHIARVFELVGQTLDVPFHPPTALDFGCGVGRLVLPLAMRTERTTGVDISPSMLAEARKNLDAAGVRNVTLAVSDATLSRVPEQFSLVHSYIVLQHIPWAEGRKLIAVLADKVEAGGILALHFLTGATASPLVKAAIRIRYRCPPVRWARNVFKGRPIFEPSMQMNVYDLDTVIGDIRALGFEHISTPREPDFDRFQSVYLLARRRSA